MKLLLSESELKNYIKDEIKRNFLNEYRGYTTNNANLVPINETNAKRLLDRHSKDGYIIISASRGASDFNLDPKQDAEQLADINNKRTKEMMEIINQSGFSYTPTYGGFIENKGEENEEHVYEKSVIVYAHDRNGNVRDIKDLYDLGLMLCKKYNQDSFLFKAPGENPKYITQDENVDMEFKNGTSFNDFDAEYFTDLHKNSDKYKNDDNRTPTRFSFNESYINPAPMGLSEAHVRHLNGEVFLSYKKN